MSTPQTPLFVKTHDFISWLIRHTQRFAKNLRHSYTLRLENTAFDFEQSLLAANVSRGQERLRWLQIADGQLLGLRALLRYAADWSLWGGRQVQFAAESVAELGRLLGAWRKGV
ncbi:MAG: four helix bundle protein, partial [Planctomycetaceae bacterium]